MLNSLTSLLLDHDCQITNFEADTSTVVGDQVMFRLAADVACSQSSPVATAALEEELGEWAVAHSAAVGWSDPSDAA